MADRSDPSEIIDEIEALTVHCRPPLMPVEQRSRWQQDWVNDLKGFPIEAIRRTFREWRQGESTKFPTPGQIMPTIRRFSGTNREAMTETPREWSYDIPDHEYHALSLTEKIRHHRIAAGLCRRKAGPMPHEGSPIKQEDMPPIWHSWRNRASNHDAEAKRLSNTLKDVEQRA